MTVAISAGSAVEDFDYWWSTRGQWIEMPNQRRNGESGVERVQHGDHWLYCKRQRGHLFHSLKYPLGRPTAQREARAIAAFRQLHVEVPELYYFGTRNRGGQWRAVLVTEALAGFTSLDEWFGCGEGHNAAQAERVLQALALSLARLHRQRWQHGCLYPKHIFVKVVTGAAGLNARVAFIDLEKSRRRMTVQAATRHDLQQLHRHWGAIPESHWPLLLNNYEIYIDAGYPASL